MKPGLPSSAERSDARRPALWLLRHRNGSVAALTLIAVALHLALRFGFRSQPRLYDAPLLLALGAGGLPLIVELGRKAIRREFGSDLLAGISILTSLCLGEYLAGSIIVLMLSGGEFLESFAMGQASSVLRALAKRMPSSVHRKAPSGLEEVSFSAVRIGDQVVVFPHETCPVDGVVVEGHGEMDEAYLTGEPFRIRKTVGTSVLSGAINGESALTVRATRLAEDSRYAKIMAVMARAEQERPRLRRLADTLAVYYTPAAIALAGATWLFTGQPVRFLAVLVIATPCPLILAIPVAIIGAISLCARRSIIVRTPAALEQVSQCRTAFFDKTGTLTYGKPRLTELSVAEGFSRRKVLKVAAGLEHYSKHPLARAILAAARKEGIAPPEASEVREPPGQGLTGVVEGLQVRITGRSQLTGAEIEEAKLPPSSGGLECILWIGGRYAAACRFRDAPRRESRSFVAHLGPKHQFHRTILVSGDRESEVRYLAEQVGIREIHAGQTPEEKLTLVRKETARVKTIYVGDGINDAPAMMAATVGMAIGQNADVTAEAADVVCLENSLRKIDEFLHISRRMRRIALQSGVGGMLLSLCGMLIAAGGRLTPVEGAIAQELIDILAIGNALRAALPPRTLHDV
ncbi:heavy metal translocating P-type ATPase [Methylacidimicrobium tartarophylax]|uniref:P-type Zn(2+) transporter n=1 Tax=Methylacidimicrobium tartarophylax TaxID=1041768 RepID=A0A5E6M994_9BACT|nr:heavy metal translocating P-type ATPase [Methylacidimicrobium tartarophylax]VVM04317.1 Copper-exporting P-type ATPase B [Methylacidimicrobium tartarophylax]